MQVSRRLVLGALCVLAAAPSARGATLSVSPSFAARQGYNDNVNAKPDDPAVPVLRESGTFIQLQPVLRASAGLAPWAAAGATYRAEWEKYDAAGDGNTLTQAGGGDFTVAAAGWRGTLGAEAFSARYPLVRDSLGHEYLDSRGGRGTLSGVAPAAPSVGLTVPASVSVARRTYPKYEVITDPDRPGDRAARVATVTTVTLGPAWKPAAWGSLQVSAQYAVDDENGLAAQRGAYADFFSFKGTGAVVRLAFAPFETLLPSPGLATLRLDVSGFTQRRAFTARLNAAGTGNEVATISSANTAISWSAMRGTAFTLEHQFVRYAGSSARASFSDNRVVAGIRLAEDFRLF